MKDIMLDLEQPESEGGLRLEPSPPADIHPGQFFLWHFLALGMWRESHPCSLSAAPQGGSLRITVKALRDYDLIFRRAAPRRRGKGVHPYR